MTQLKRRSTYRVSMLRSDYFVLRALSEFIASALTAKLYPGAFVVDVGCGEGPWRSLVRELGAHYLGLDIAQNSTGSVSALCTANALPLADHAVDVVLCTEVLEHVPDPHRAITELKRVLRTGGLAIVTTPFLYPLHEEPRDFQRLTTHQLRRLALCAGFVPDQIETRGNELEVLATNWDRLWSNALSDRLGIIRTLLLAVLRLSVNLLAATSSRLVGGSLPAKGYLSTVAVLRAVE